MSFPPHDEESRLPSFVVANLGDNKGQSNLLPDPIAVSTITQQKLFEHRRRRRLKKNKVWVSRATFVLQLGLCFALGYGLWRGVTADFWKLATTPDALSLRQATPSGSAYVSPAVLRQAINQTLGPLQKAYPDGIPIVLISPKMLETTLLQQFPVLQQVSVGRQLFPARVTVSVLEKQAWATVYTSLQPDAKPPQVPIGAFQPSPPLRPTNPIGTLVANQALLAFTPTIMPVHQGVPIIASPNMTLLSLNNTHERQWRQQAQLLCQQLQQLATQYANQLGPLRWLNVSNPNNLQAAFGQDTDPIVTLEMGELDDRLTQRLERIIALIPKLPELRPTIKGVDLRWQHELVLQKRTTTSSSSSY
jgi:hypothetical protein